MHEAIGHIALIADRDQIIAVAEERRSSLLIRPADQKGITDCVVLADEKRCRFSDVVMAPIITGGDPIGAVIICSKEPAVETGELELKLAETAVSFLAKQMEQ